MKGSRRPCYESVRFGYIYVCNFMEVVLNLGLSSDMAWYTWETSLLFWFGAIGAVVAKLW